MRWQCGSSCVVDALPISPCREAGLDRRHHPPERGLSGAHVTSIDSAPAAVKSESHSSPKKDSLSSDVTSKLLQIRSPSAENKRPKWVPPAASGGSRNSSSPLAVVSVKSPNQSLRLGLSRLARVKPLHPNATSS
uniref:RAD51-associated protein 1-like n=1 Tax=Callithrix jacchus TaxID=9483 RepID=UPI00159E9B55|nr:RAD51-associated protein 1-like [Callithrix jacchus]